MPSDYFLITVLLGSATLRGFFDLGIEKEEPCIEAGAAWVGPGATRVWGPAKDISDSLVTICAELGLGEPSSAPVLGGWVLWIHGYHHDIPGKACPQLQTICLQTNIWRQSPLLEGLSGSSLGQASLIPSQCPGAITSPATWEKSSFLWVALCGAGFTPGWNQHLPRVWSDRVWSDRALPTQHPLLPTCHTAQITICVTHWERMRKLWKLPPKCQLKVSSGYFQIARLYAICVSCVFRFMCQAHDTLMFSPPPPPNAIGVV